MPVSSTGEPVAGQIESVPVVDTFEQVAAEVLANPEVLPVVASSPVVPVAAPVGAPEGVSRLLVGLTPSQVQQWLEMPFNVAANVLKDETYKLQPHEVAIMLGPVTVLTEKYLPAVLAKSDNPELVMLGVGVMAYAARVGATVWKHSKAEAEKRSVERPQPQALMGSGPIEPQAAAVLEGDAVPVLAVKAPTGTGELWKPVSSTVPLPA